MKTSHKSDELKRGGGPQIGYLWPGVLIALFIVWVTLNVIKVCHIPLNVL